MKHKSVVGYMIQSEENLSDTITSDTPLKQGNTMQEKIKQIGRVADRQIVKTM